LGRFLPHHGEAGLVEIRQAPGHEFRLYGKIGRVGRFERAEVRHERLVAGNECLRQANGLPPKPGLLTLGEPEVFQQIASQTLIGRVLRGTDLEVERPYCTAKPRRHNMRSDLRH